MDEVHPAAASPFDVRAFASDEQKSDEKLRKVNRNENIAACPPLTLADTGLAIL